MGVIEINPKEILVDGIRRELVKEISKMLHFMFIFEKKGDNDELQKKLDNVKARFKGMKKSFEYIQDFLNIPGEQIWREEVSRIFRISLDKEGTKLISKKFTIQAEMDSDGIELPRFGLVESDPSPTFLGRVVNQLLSILTPNDVLYLDQVSNFYSTVNGQQVFGLRNVVSIEKDLGIIFLQSLDQMTSYRIVNDIKQFVRDYGFLIGGGGISRKTIAPTSRIEGYATTCKVFEKSITDFYTATEEQYRQYQALMDGFKPIYSKLISTVLSIGQVQLIRRILLSHINFVAKMETPYFYSCLSNLNDTTFNSMEALKSQAKEIKEDVIEEDEDEYNSDDSAYEEKKRKEEERKKAKGNQYWDKDENETKGDKILKSLLSDLSTVLESSGFLEPMNKVYVLVKDLDFMALNMLLLTLTAGTYLRYDLDVNSLLRKTKSNAIDGPCFVSGMVTIFRQFHNSHFKKYLVYMSHYIRCSIEVSKEKGSLKKVGQYPEDVTICFGILEEILRFGKFDREVVKQVFGVNFLFDNFKNIKTSD